MPGNDAIIPIPLLGAITAWILTGASISVRKPGFTTHVTAVMWQVWEHIEVPRAAAETGGWTVHDIAPKELQAGPGSATTSRQVQV